MNPIQIHSVFLEEHLFIEITINQQNIFLKPKVQYLQVFTAHIVGHFIYNENYLLNFKGFNHPINFISGQVNFILNNNWCQIRHYNGSQVSSNCTLLSAKKHRQRNRNTDRKMYLLEFAGGWVIQVLDFHANTLHRVYQSILKNH